MSVSPRPPGPEGRQRLARTRVRAIARRNAYVLRRSGHRLFDVVIWPVVDVLLFGSLGVFVSRQPGPGGVAAGYLLSGILLWHVVYQAQIGLATGFLEETWSRQLLSLMVTPLTETEYAAGVALFGLVKLAVGLGVVVLTALGFYAFDVTDLGWGLVPVAAVLLVVGWTIALFVIGMVLRFGTGADVLAWGILFVIMPLSGVFYPVRALPPLLRPLSSLLPSTHAFAAGRALLEGRGMPWGELGVAAGTTVVGVGAAVVFLRHMLAVFRRRGYVTRYS